MLQLKLSEKGELLIPKKIRERLHLKRMVIMNIKKKSIEIKPAENMLIEKWEKRARQKKEDIAQWTYGDKLYEEGF